MGGGFLQRVHTVSYGSLGSYMTPSCTITPVYMTPRIRVKPGTFEHGSHFPDSVSPVIHRHFQGLTAIRKSR
jgi:hypothetical protein